MRRRQRRRLGFFSVVSYSGQHQMHVSVGFGYPSLRPASASHGHSEMDLVTFLTWISAVNCVNFTIKGVGET